MRKKHLKMLTALIAAAAITLSPVAVQAEETEGEVVQTEEDAQEEAVEIPESTEEAVVESADDFIDIPVEGDEEGDGGEGAEDGAADAFVDTGDAEYIEAESSVETAESVVYLWQYRYAGIPNRYLETICDWLAVYHADAAIPDTGMIPAISIVGVDDSDRNDIRLYGHFLITDYALNGTTLMDLRDELITGCMHLQQVSEDSYVLSKAEVLDSTNPSGSALVLTGGDGALMQGLLAGGISTAQRMQYIRDFVWSNGIAADSYQDETGAVRALGYEAVPAPEWVGNTVEASCTDHIITVGWTSASNAVLMLHEKQGDGSWATVLEVPAYIGREGLGKTREGDGRTPVGTFSFLESFGLAEDPGSLIPYTMCDDSYYWNCDPNSGRYNQLVTTAEYTDFDKKLSERIADESYACRYALSTSYNEDGTPYEGSGIFLHCFSPDSFSTEGGVTIPEDAFIYLIQRIDSSARMIIDTEKNLKTQYLTAEARETPAE